MGSRMTPVTDTNRKDDAVGTHKIRTTITPGEVITVDDAEHLDLSRQGLILDEKKSKALDKKDEEAAAAAAASDNKKGE